MIFPLTRTSCHNFLVRSEYMRVWASLRDFSHIFWLYIISYLIYLHLFRLISEIVKQRLANINFNDIKCAIWANTSTVPTNVAHICFSKKQFLLCENNIISWSEKRGQVIVATICNELMHVMQHVSALTKKPDGFWLKQKHVVIVVIALFLSLPLYHNRMSYLNMISWILRQQFSETLVYFCKTAQRCVPDNNGYYY
jgi:hypothetical protein